MSADNFDIPVVGDIYRRHKTISQIVAVDQKYVTFEICREDQTWRDAVELDEFALRRKNSMDTGAKFTPSPKRKEAA